MLFAHRYTTETEYQVIEYYTGGYRIVPKDQHDYLKWCETNTPQIEADGRFLSVVDGKLIVDPTREEILAAEAAERAIESAAIEKKAQGIAAAKEKIIQIEADVGKVSDIPALKAIVLDLVKQVKILTE